MTDALNGAPGYWRAEASGILAPVVQKYLLGRRPLTPTEIGVLRDYFTQWAEAPVWDTNPHADGFSRAVLQSLRDDARAIRTMKDVDQWVQDALDQGMDPL